MINLLPPDGKRALRTQYWMRVVATYGSLIGFALAITTALLLPTFFHVRFQSDALDLSAHETSSEADDFAYVEAAIGRANAISELLIETAEHVPPSAVINEIEFLADSRALITTIDITTNAGAVSRVTMAGVAPDRGALVSFRDAVEAHEYFSAMNLPLSTLARDTDISFQVELTLTELLSAPQ